MNAALWPSFCSARVSARPMTRCPPTVASGLEVTTAKRFTKVLGSRGSPVHEVLGVRWVHRVPCVKQRSGRDALASRSSRHNAGRNTYGDGPWRDVLADHASGTDDGMLTHGHTVEYLGARPNPRAVPEGHSGRDAALGENRLRWIRKVVIAADYVAVCGHQHTLADPDAARRKHLAVEPDVGAVRQLDIAVLARENRVAADEHAIADFDAGIGRALGVEQTLIVDHDVSADTNLVRVTERDMLAEDHVAAARAEEQRVERLSQRQPEGARPSLRER